jgi:hypothetical protein
LVPEYLMRLEEHPDAEENAPAERIGGSSRQSTREWR